MITIIIIIMIIIIMNFYSSDKNTYSVSDITLKCKEASAKYSTVVVSK